MASHLLMSSSMCVTFCPTSPTRPAERMQINCHRALGAGHAMFASTLQVSIRLQPISVATSIGDVPSRALGTIEEELLKLGAE